MRGAATLSLVLLCAATRVHTFDFDDDEVGGESPPGQNAYFAVDSDGTAGDLTVPFTYSFGASKVDASLVVRGGKLGTQSGKVVMRTTPAKVDSNGIDNLKKLAASGQYYTVSVPSVLSEADSAPLYASASACSLLASRFEEHVELTMSPGKDRVLALTYALPTVPARCPSTSPLPRIALDEVVFNTSAAMIFPEDGPKPLGRVHEASFLPPTAAAAAAAQARSQAQQGGGGGGGAAGEGGDGQPPPQQSFLRKYWMYILPVVVLMMSGSPPAEEGEGGKDGARPAGAAAAGGASRRK
jgi:hypothetical protein